MESFFIDILIKVGWYLVPATFILTFLAMVLGVVREPKGSIKFVVGFAVLIIIFVIAYNAADPTPPPGLLVDVPPTATTVKMVSAGITTFLASMALAVVALVGSSIAGIFR